MHWTLITLLALCGLCAVSNAVQFVAVRTVRAAGILICTAWVIQQSYWWTFRADSLALFVACDAAIIGWFLLLLRRGRVFSPAERLIAATIPITTALGVFEWANGGHTTASWWANWWIVAGQMVFGLPPVEWALRRAVPAIRKIDPWHSFDLRKRHA